MGTRVEPISVLRVEDDEGDYLLTRELLAHQGALDALAWSQERYALAMRAANDGIWDWELERQLVYFSPRWHAILGQPEQATEGPPEHWFRLVHEEDLPRLRAAIDAHLAGR